MRIHTRGCHPIHKKAHHQLTPHPLLHYLTTTYLQGRRNFTLNNSLNTDEPIIMSDIADDSDVSSDTYSGAQGVSAESENMDSRQPSFTLGKHPRQSVSISSDVETESTDSLCVAECCNGADKPYQPRISYSRLSKRKQGKYF